MKSTIVASISLAVLVFGLGCTGRGVDPRPGVELLVPASYDPSDEKLRLVVRVTNHTGASVEVLESTEVVLRAEDESVLQIRLAPEPHNSELWRVHVEVGLPSGTAPKVISRNGLVSIVKHRLKNGDELYLSVDVPHSVLSNGRHTVEAVVVKGGVEIARSPRVEIGFIKGVTTDFVTLHIQ